MISANGEMSNEMHNNGTNKDVPNTEPTELDPCMESSTKGRKSNYFCDYREKIRTKTGLSKSGEYIVGGIVVITILLVIVVIALASTWPRISHKYQFPICTKPECLRTAAQVSFSLNILNLKYAAY